jgi:hypothetical protein
MLLVGQKFGRWVVQEAAPTQGHGRRWVCRCECGRVNTVRQIDLQRGMSRSCGCLRDEKSAQRARHGMSTSPEYYVWNAARERCFNLNDKRFPLYGGRGITMCAEWRADFAAFIRDMGPRPSPKHTIDRIDNDGHYEPGNCRWVLNAVQQRNRRDLRWVTFRGETRILSDWAAHLGVPKWILFGRVRLGWTVERMLTEPVTQREKQIC